MNYKNISVFGELKKFFSELSMATSISGKLFLISSATGIVVGFAIILFNLILEFSIKSFEHLILILPQSYYIILIPALGGLLAGLIRYFSKTSFSYGCGTDAIIETIHKNDGNVPNKLTPIAGILSASMTIASGGSCGREGPATFIGTGFASITAYLIKKLKIDAFFGITITKNDERIMGICGAAAGVGAIFRAPIGGAIFSTEVLYRYGFEFTALFPAILSSIISFTLFSLFYSYEPLFEMQAIWSFGFSTIFFTIILSIISSFVGSCYVHIFHKIHKFFLKLKLPNWIKPAIGGLLQGLLVYYVAKELWGIGYGTIQNTIEGNLTITVMCVLLFGKILSTSLTVASGGSGGLIAPSLFIGAMLGGIIGKVAGLMFLTNIPIGIFVVLGMGALFSAVGKVPFALPLLIIEATRNMSLMLPLFIATTIGYVLSGKSTLYETQPLRVDLNELGVNVLGETEGSFIEKYTAKDIMIKNNSAIFKYANLNKIRDFIVKSKDPFYPVIDQDHKLLGIISFSKVKFIFSSEEDNQLIVASDVAIEVSDTVQSDTSLKKALLLFNNSNSDYIPVIDTDGSNKFIGRIVKNDVMELLRKELVKKTFKIGRQSKSKKDKYVTSITSNNYRKIYYLEIESNTKLNTITEMVNFLSEEKLVTDKPKTINHIMEREASVTTGVGSGVAFPHMRSNSVSELVLIYGKSVKGVEFNSLDKKNVHHIFMILTPINEGNTMLSTMRTISSLLKHDEFKDALLKAESQKVVLELFQEWEEKIKLTQ